MSRPNDFSQRQLALDIEQSWIVQAPAGSGKTGILVYRMMKLLAVAKEPEEILAITFTRKAAKEMRDRLIELLEAAEKQHNSDNSFEQQGLLLAQAVLANDAKNDWQLLNMPHRLNIETIDALCARLVSTMPWLSRLGERPQTTENPSIHFTFAVEQLLMELLDDDSVMQSELQTLLLSLDNNFQKAKKLLIPMLGKRDQWLRHFLGKDIQRSRSDFEATWRAISESMLSDLLNSVPTGAKDKIVQLAQFAAQQRVDDELQKAPRDRNPKKLDFPFKVFIDKQRFPRADFADIDLWLGIKNLLMTDGGAIRKPRGVNIKLGFPAKSDEKEAFVELLSHLDNEPQFIEQLGNIAIVPPATFSEEQWQQLLNLEKVLRRLLAHLQLRFHNQKECDFSEVSLRANQALSDLGQPTDLALRMDYQIQHILVDEFQDTSHAQAALLENLTKGWQQGDGRSLFLVGDPMQSIYRFREADVGLFVKLSEGRGTINDISLNPLILSENFRSKKGLVDWFNAVFAASFPQSNNEASGAITYSPASSHKQEGTKPRLNAFHNIEQEAEHVVSVVKQSLQKGDKKIAILVRSRSQLGSILPALNAAKISYQGVDIKPLNKTQDVLDVLSLCKAIIRLDDKVSWLSILRAPWLGLSLVELTDLAEGKDAIIWERLNNPSRIARLSDTSKHRLSIFKKTMRLALEQKQRVPLAALTQWTWQQLGGESCLQNIHVDELTVVWHLIQDLDQGGDIEKVSDLDIALEGLYAQSDSHVQTIAECEMEKQRVMISTIHKAKGLQYDTVILPGLSRKGANNDKEILRWAEVVNNTGQEKLLIAALNSKEHDNSHYNYLQNLEKQRDANEQLRLLYVACTRAETNLYLSGTFYHRKTDGEITARGLGQSLLSGVWSYLQDSFQLEELDVDLLIDESEKAIDQHLYRLPADFSFQSGDSIDWQVKEPARAKSQEITVSYDWASSIAQATGIVLHNWLEHHGESLLDFKVDQKQKKRWQAEFQSMRLDPQQVQSAVKRMSIAISNMQNDPKAQWIFLESSHTDCQNEYAITTVEDGVIVNYRIDRTFVDKENIRWIIDYKSTTHFDSDVEAFIEQQIAERAYKEQLDRYAHAFAQLDNRKIKLGIYFPLLKEWREWSYHEGLR